MSNFTARREEATRRTMKALARLMATDPLPVRLEDGRSPVVVTFPEEPVSQMIARLERAGGQANVVIDYVDYFSVAAFFSTSVPAMETDDPTHVHHEANVGMLLEWLRLQPEGAGEFQMRKPVHNDASAPVQVKEHEYSF